jgi:hypothetical protein
MHRNGIPVVGDDGFGDEDDAQRRELLGDEERVGVEPIRSQQFAADRNHFRRSGSVGSRHATQPGITHSTARNEMFA